VIISKITPVTTQIAKPPKGSCSISERIKELTHDNTPKIR